MPFVFSYFTWRAVVTLLYDKFASYLSFSYYREKVSNALITLRVVTLVIALCTATARIAIKV